nr:Hypothetical protein CBG04564 [Haemonchus contortus]
MIRSAFFTVIAVSRVFSKSVEPHGVRTGIVPIFDAQPVPFNEIQTTPTYNQAQYYRMIQADLQSTPPPTTNSPYKDIWSHISDKWQNTKKTLFDSGIERDWRSLWGKLSGAMEPFMADLAEQMGRVVNAFIKQQNNRMKKVNARSSSPECS